MAIPTTRDEFKEFCLRALGSPVIQINVDDMQVDDRLDQALYKYQQFHMDAVVRTYLKHEITPSTLTFTAAASGTFANGEQLHGETSNAYGFVVKPGAVPGANAIYAFAQTSPVAFMNTVPSSTSSGDKQPFQVGEVVRGLSSNATGTLASITLGDMDNKYFPIPSSVIAVNKVFPPFDATLGVSTSDILFDPQAQFNIGMLYNFTSNSIIPYVMGRQFQQLLGDTFRGRPGIRFQRHQGRLYLDINWYTNFSPRQFIVVDCYRVIDPADSTSVWSDQWLQAYATALIKKQWAQNMSKYQGVQLPGGVTLDAKSMMLEVIDELKMLDDELKTTYQLPIDFVIG
jgi:hypothetical protein